MIMGNALYLRVDDETRPVFEARGAKPFSYGTKKRRVLVKAYCAVPEELLDEPDALVLWARRALAVAETSPRPKRPRQGS